MKKNHMPLGGNRKDSYANSVAGALGISESRNEELHNKVLEGIGDMQSRGEKLTKSGVLEECRKISDDPTELVYLGFMAGETFAAMSNPLASLMAGIGAAEEEPA